ncbi:type II secretion system protein GspG [Haloferula chungangensis]
MLIQVFVLLSACDSNDTVNRELSPERAFKVLAAAVNTYAREAGEIPSTEQGLAALVERPENFDEDARWTQVMTRQMRDPWLSTYGYSANKDTDPPQFTLTSRGPDGVVSADDISEVFSVNLGDEER